LLTSIKSCLKQLLIEPSCALCKQPINAATTDLPVLCNPCQQRLGLAENAIQGISPLPWRAAAWYTPGMRQWILSIRTERDFRSLQAICTSLQRDLAQQSLLVPIPGWKAKKRSNPLPELMCRCLERPTLQLLRRCRPTVGQHRLNRRQRVSNQSGSFSLHLTLMEEQEEAHHWKRLSQQAQVWLVDDILTTGATVLAARQTLKAWGITAKGVLCLARTPRGSTL
tara:strand:+ start:559 stop:1233 length:675 start_codon:yes stop_codon:yes gene_type:complete